MDSSRRLWLPVRAGLVIIVAGLLAVPLMAVARAAEPGRAPALCTFDVHDTASPGWVVTPTRGTSHGLGTITCVGALDGKQLTGGPAHFEWWYSYGSSDVPAGGNRCGLVGGAGTWQANLPTIDGSALALTGPWSFTGNVAGELHGQLGGFAVEMVWETLSEPDHLDEDCVTKPTRHFRWIAQGMVG
jgi:hypothetical protein